MPAAPPSGQGLRTPQIVGGGVLLLIGVLWLLERTGAIDVGVTVVLGIATMIIGISLMLLANRGPHAGLIVFGTILGLVTLATAIAPFEGFQGGVSDRTIAITSADAISPDYNVAAGTLTIDLREIEDLAPATPLSASIGMGELVIRIPEGTAIVVNAKVGAGELEILGKSIDGVGIDESYTSPGLESGSPSLVLDLQAFTGRVEVSDE
ncbi:MAG TPA: LiaF domain-containing protein [Acidimicrobiia bacterium]|jgi:hypothetical protein